MTIKELKKNLENFSDETEVLVFEDGEAVAFKVEAVGEFSETGEAVIYFDNTNRQ